MQHGKSSYARHFFPLQAVFLFSFSQSCKCVLFLTGISWCDIYYLLTEFSIFPFLFRKDIVKRPFQRTYEPWANHFIMIKTYFSLFPFTGNKINQFVKRDIGILKAICTCLFFFLKQIHRRQEKIFLKVHLLNSSKTPLFQI